MSFSRSENWLDGFKNRVVHLIARVYLGVLTWHFCIIYTESKLGKIFDVITHNQTGYQMQEFVLKFVEPVF